MRWSPRSARRRLSPATLAGPPAPTSSPTPSSRSSDRTMTTVFHCSDLHFGHPAVPEQYEAMEALIAERRYDVVAISGDLSQRARSGEFQRARVFIQHAKRFSEVIVVPGNHDVAW